MKKKILLVISLIVFFSTNVVVKADDSSISGSAGTHDQEDFTENFSKGMTIEQRGLRLTVVDIQGEKISENVVDYWESGAPTGATMLSGSNFKTYIVNHKGLVYEVKPSATYNYKQGDPQNIKGASVSTWESKHLKLEEIISDVEPGDKCINPAFLDELGYDLCKALEDDCDALEKTYILVEPLMLTHLIENHSVKYVFSGTEYSFYLNNFKNEGKLVEYEGSMVPEGEKIIRSQIGGKMWRELVNMRLSCFSDDDCTWGLKSGSSRYAYMPDKISDNAFWNPLNAHAGYSRDTNNNVYGTSMHLVWFGKLKDKCEESCCVPCGDDTQCIENEDDPYCCYADEIATGVDEEGKPICEDASKYWDTPEGEELYDNVCLNKCIPPDDNPTLCCDDSEWKLENPTLYEELCTGSYCENYVMNPEIDVDDCDTEEPSISYFRDGVFNSENGQFSDYNTIEKIENSISGGYLPLDWLNRIVNEEGDNTFLTLAYSDDFLHTTKYTYCTRYCQQIFEVELPENNPVAQAGRYFVWSIEGSEDILARASGGMLCAVDIDLDRIISEYNLINSEAKSAASAAANLTCGSLAQTYGYGLVQTKGVFNSCEEYADKAKEIGVCCSIQCKDWGTEAIPYDCSTPNEPNKICYTTVSYCKQSETESEAELRCQLQFSKQCSSIQEKYVSDVEEYDTKISNLLKELSKCYNSAKSEMFINMGVELSYETLFGLHEYSTLNNQIVKTEKTGTQGATFGCYDITDTSAECNGNHIFAISDRSDGTEYPISCDGSKTTWTEDEEYEDKSDGAMRLKSVEVAIPNAQHEAYYDPNNIQIITGITGFDRETGNYVGAQIESYQAGTNWNSIFLGYMSTYELYKLDESINACICKDGTVKDKENGSCKCEETPEYIGYEKFITTYNNYQVLEDGTLSVEFMNGTGLYPISLKYRTIGSVDEENGTEGHFDSIIGDENPEFCNADDGCVYGDSSGMCRFIVKNKIMANPSDVCVGDDCETDTCDDENCPPDLPDSDYDDCLFDSNASCGNVAGLNLIYRVVDLDNPFVNTDGTIRILPEYSNWYEHESLITNNRNVNGNQLYSNLAITPLYSATLTPAVIKEIRASNASLGGDYLSATMIYPNGSIAGGGYSLFVHNFTFNGENVIKVNTDLTNTEYKTDDLVEQFENINATFGNGGQ